MMTCIAPNPLRTSIGFAAVKRHHTDQPEGDIVSTFVMLERSRHAVQSVWQLSTPGDSVRANFQGRGGLQRSACGAEKLRNDRASRKFWGWQEPAVWSNGGANDAPDVNLLCTSLRIGELRTRVRTKFLEKRWKPGDCAVSAIVSNSEDIGRRPQRGSSSGLKSPVSSERNGRVPGLSPVNHREKLQVAVDVDEVLGFFVSTLNTFCEEEYRMQYHVSQYHIYDFKTVWGCSQEEANHRVHAFFESKHFNQGIPPIPGAIQALLRLQAECHLVVVTSRQHVIKQPTLEWIDVHYPGIFKEVHFGNHYALEGVARPKSDICKSLGVEILIDDNPKYALECAEHGIEVLLFDWNDTYPWSKTECGPVHPLITRVRDWTEVEGVLLARASVLEP